jgi:hypothetical protein
VTGPFGIGVDGGGVKIVVTQSGRLEKSVFSIGDELEIAAVLEMLSAEGCTKLAKL